MCEDGRARSRAARRDAPVDLRALQRAQLGGAAEVAPAERREELLAAVMRDDGALAEVGEARAAVLRVFVSA